MFVNVKCPNCKATHNMDSRGMAGREIKCSKCKKYFKFAAEPKPKPKPDSGLKAAFKSMGRGLANVAEQIGLIAFYDKIRGWLPGVGVVLLLVTLGLGTFFIIRLFVTDEGGSGGPDSQHVGGPPSAPLTDKEKDVQWAASDPLGYHRAKLKHTEAATRVKAARSLGNMGARAEPALDDLLIAVYDKQPEVVAAVDKALQAIGPPAKLNGHWITQALSSKAKPARAWALRCLAAPEHAELKELPLVIALLNDPDADLTQLAAKALTSMQAKDRATVLASLYEDKSVSTKRYVTQHLAESGKVTLKDLPSLVKYVNDANQDVRLAAVKALDHFTSEDRKSVLLALAKEDGPSSSLYVASFLAKPDTQVMVETIPSLLTWLSAPQAELQKQSALALANIGPEHAAQVSKNQKVLGQALAHQAKPARQWALRQLATPENAVLDQLPGVIAFLSDPELGPLAEKALANFQAKDRHTVVSRLLDDKTTPAKLYVTQLLAEPGKVALGDLPGLLKFLKDPSPDVRLKTAQALDNYSEKDRKSVLLSLARDEDQASQTYLTRYLARLDGASALGAPTKTEWAELLKRTQQPETRLLAWDLLARLDGDEADLGKTFAPLLKDAEPKLRALAVKTLGKLGKEAAPFLADLKAALADDDPAVRVQATWALAGLGQVLPGLAGFELTTQGTAPKIIWKDGQHNGPAALARLGNYYYAAWRSGKTDKDLPAKILVLRAAAANLEKWDKAAEFDLTEDGRAPQLLVTGGRMLLSWQQKDIQLSVTQDGLVWTDPQQAVVEFLKGAADTKVQSLGPIRQGPDGAFYALAGCGSPGSSSLSWIMLRSLDGQRFKALHKADEGLNALLTKLGLEGQEAAWTFLESGTMVAAVKTAKTGLVAFSDPPYQNWRGYDSGIPDFAGPSLFKTREGVLLACRAPAKGLKENATVVFAVGTAGLLHPWTPPNLGPAFAACFAPGLAEDEPLLVLSARVPGEDADAAAIYLARPKAKASKISLPAK